MKPLYIFLTTLMLAAAGAIFFFADREVPRGEDRPEMSAQSSIEETLQSMTIEEKVGQMFLHAYWGEKSNDVLVQKVASGKVGAVMLMKANVQDGNIQELTKRLQASSTLSKAGFPLLIAVDQEGGIVSRINDPSFVLTPQSDIETKEAAYQVAINRGEALQSVGISVNFSPVLEHITDPDSFLYDRVFRGEKEDLIAFGSAMVKGYEASGIAATVKHFPGHENASLDSHKELPISPVEPEAFPEHARVFAEVIVESRPSLVMTAHVLFPEIDSEYPATLSPKIIEYLREEIGFGGVIITDDMNMGAITSRFGREDVAIQAVLAGNDMLLFVVEPEAFDEAYEAVLNAVKEGRISETRIDESVRRILELKSKVGDNA